MTAAPSRGLTCAGTGGSYYHSWYITDTDANPDLVKDTDQNNVAHLALKDAQWASKNCTVKYTASVTILDFGHLTTLSDGSYGVFNSKFVWISDAAVENLAEVYANTWYAQSSNCPVLYLGIGTTNERECLDNKSSCNVATAGQWWDITIHDVMTYIAGKGYSWQVLPEAASDIETEWDSWSTSQNFINGVANQEARYQGTHPWLIDYGDADLGCNSWTQQNVYDAAWGIGWDVPVPETYNPSGTCGYVFGQVQPWLDVNNACNSKSITCNSGPMQYYGAMTECSGSDPLPSGPTSTCTSTGGNAGEYTPDSGLTALGSQVAPTPWETNLQWA